MGQLVLNQQCKATSLKRSFYLPAVAPHPSVRLQYNTSVSYSNAAAKINVRSHDTVSYEMMGMQMEETVF